MKNLDSNVKDRLEQLFSAYGFMPGIPESSLDLTTKVELLMGRINADLNSVNYGPCVLILYDVAKFINNLYDDLVSPSISYEEIIP